MKHRRLQFFRIASAFLFTLVLLGASSQCSGAVKSALTGVNQSKEEVGRIVIHEESSSALRMRAQELDSARAKVPKDADLSTSEKADLENAAQIAAHLKDMAEMVGVSENIASLISEDAGELVMGSILQRRQPSAALDAHRRKTSESLLRDTMCSQFSSWMSAMKKSEAERQRKGFTPLSPNKEGVFTALNQYFGSAQSLIKEANQVFDAGGFSKDILTKANTYIDRLKATMTAASWQNEGAFHAYMRHCVIK